jgi:NADH-quinone oxidoreductase subunit G
MVYRYLARDNDAVNKGWLCDEGRLSYKFINENRVMTALVGRGEEQHEIGWEEAVSKAADLLAPYRGDGAPIGFAVSPQATTEEAFAFVRFARQAFGATAVFIGGKPVGESDGFLRNADKNPNREGVRLAIRAAGCEAGESLKLAENLAAGRTKAAVFFGADLPAATERVERLTQVETIVVLATNNNELTRSADIVLPLATFAEADGTFINEEGRVQRLARAFPPRGEARGGVAAAAAVARRLGVDGAPGDPGESFAALSKCSSHLDGFSFDSIPPEGRPLKTKEI